MDNKPVSEHQALQQVINALTAFDNSTRGRILKSTIVFYDLAGEVNFGRTAEVPNRSVQPWTDGGGFSERSGASARRSVEREPTFSGHQVPSAKEFVVQKDPRNDVERIVVLAYYLAHYREQPHFKTSELSKLNTEAAQRKFSNTAYSVNNAAQSGYFVAAQGNTKQLSPMGEQFVEALPDRDAAKSVLQRWRERRKGRLRTGRSGRSDARPRT